MAQKAEKLDPIAVIQAHYEPQGQTYKLLVDHGRDVARKALQIADRLDHLEIDRDFVFEAAVLHDIGIYLTRAPGIGCTGDAPYVCHGYLGGRILRKQGLPQHALVCERHVGCGISAAEIRRRRIPLPARDMLPVSIEEQLICYADKFFSKNNGSEKTVAEIVAGLTPYGEDQVERFLSWAAFFDGRCLKDLGNSVYG